MCEGEKVFANMPSQQGILLSDLMKLSKDDHASGTSSYLVSPNNNH